MGAADVGTLGVPIFLHDEESPCILLNLGLEVPGYQHGSIQTRGNDEKSKFLFIGLAVANLKPNDIIVFHYNLKM